MRTELVQLSGPGFRMGSSFLGRQFHNIARPVAHAALNAASVTPGGSLVASSLRQAARSLPSTGSHSPVQSFNSHPNFFNKVVNTFQDLPKPAKYGVGALGVLILGGIVFKIVK